MKEILIPSALRSVVIKLLMPALVLILLQKPNNLFAQADSAKKGVAAQEDSSLLSPSMEFISVQKGDSTIDLKATLKAKVKGTSMKLALLKVSFIQVADAAEKALGFVITDANGKAVLHVKTDSLIAGKDGKLNFKAQFAGNKAMETADGEVSIKKAILELTPVKEDSVLTVKIKLSDAATKAPVSAALVGVYVNRLFFPLKLGEGTTDSIGEATVQIPSNLPGDTKGNITLLAKLDENEAYGNLETAVVQPWGTPVSDKVSAQPRALWSQHPPIWMLVTFIVLMTVVWGHYIVIVVQLFRLRKEEPQPDGATV